MTDVSRRSRVPAGVRAGGEFTTGARAEAGVSLVQVAERPVPPDALVKVPFPGRPEASPMYEGLAADACGHLSPGEYAATSLDGTVTYRLRVQAPPAPPAKVITIMDPEDPYGPPVYEGRADRAGTLLAPGRYEAFAIDDAFDQYTVLVPEPADPPVTWELARSDGSRTTQTGVSCGVRVHLTWETGAASTEPVTVRIGDEHSPEYGQTYYDRAENGWRVFCVDGDTRYGVASRDEAVADLVVRYRAAAR